MNTFETLQNTFILKQIESEMKYIKEIIGFVEDEFDKFLSENNYQLKEIYYEPPEDNIKNGPSGGSCSCAEDPANEKIGPELNPSNESDNLNEPDPEEDVDSLSHMVKKLYKFLSVFIHPDKHPEETEKYTELFKKLTQFLKQNNLQGMVNIANHEKIDLSPLTDLSDFIGDSLDNKIKSLKFEISLIKSRVYWRWFFEKDYMRRKKLIEEYFEKVNRKIDL